MIKMLSAISRYFNWDILWRIVSRLDRKERLYLGLRIFQDEVNQYFLRGEEFTWTTYGWDFSMTRSLMENGHFQGPQLRAATSWIKANNLVTPRRNVIVDVGANIGTSSLPLARILDCRVLAIEPFPENFKLLRANVRQNGLEKRIICVQSAVHRQAGKITMFMPEGRCGGAAVYTRDAAAEGPVRRITEVPAAGLIEILKSAGLTPEEVVFVWSDTEGSETSVLETGRELWKAGVPLYLEVYPRALEHQGNLAKLAGLVERDFDEFILIDALIREGDNASRLTASEFAGFLDDLARTSDITDVLLIPSGYGRIKE